MLYACDQKWWQVYFPEVSRTFPGELWTVSEGARQEFGINWVHGHSAMGGLSRSPQSISCGKNSGYQALGLLYLFGCKRVTLYGYDFQLDGARTHWHGDHPNGLSNNRGGRFPSWRREMDALAHDLKANGVTVINATRRTALRCFPQLPLEEALAGP